MTKKFKVVVSVKNRASVNFNELIFLLSSNQISLLKLGKPARCMKLLMHQIFKKDNHGIKLDCLRSYLEVCFS